MDSTYDVVKSLGSGTFGKVYLIHHRQTNEKYALKIINLGGGENKLEEAMQEVKAMSKVRHDGIVHLKTFYKDEDHLHILSEYCEGGDLNNFLKQRDSCQQLPEALIRIWMSQLTRGLEHLHKQRIIHRDIKPHNIFLGNKMAAKLGDLGIAKVFETCKTSAAKSFQGTLSYMAPEMFQDDPYDYKVDIWGLGCCFYEMMSLCRAFDGKGMSDLIRNITFEQLPDFKTRCRVYSRELRCLVRSMLQRDPSKRKSATDILEDSLVPEKHCDVPPIFFHLCKTREAADEYQEMPERSSECSTSSDNTLTSDEHSSSIDMVISPVAHASIRQISLQIEEVEKKQENNLVHSALHQLQSLDVSKNDSFSNGMVHRGGIKNSSARMRRHVNNSSSSSNRPKSKKERSKQSDSEATLFEVDDCVRDLRAHLMPFDSESLETIAASRKHSLSKNISDEIKPSSATEKNSREDDHGFDNCVTIYTRGQVATFSNTASFSIDPPSFPQLSQDEHTSEEETIRPTIPVSCSGELTNAIVLKRQLEMALGKDLLQKCLSTLKLISLKDFETSMAVLQDIMGLAKYTEHSEMLLLLANLQNNH